MCQMLLSINPKYVKEILNGKKKYEYRKFRCRSDVNKIIIYSTAPEKKVVGEAEIEEIIEDEKMKVWNITKNYSGISYDFYEEYYKEKKYAYAYRLKNIIEYEEAKSLSDYGVDYAPQSYRYLYSEA
ncbi:MAG: ASCH domain-containing protein [Lachnospiraceae bacterium]|nr:ASCH domain-containing protein [Lachnospiraceae bacterium]